jgi:hypothetical protein
MFGQRALAIASPFSQQAATVAQGELRSNRVRAPRQGHHSYPFSILSIGQPLSMQQPIQIKIRADVRPFGHPKLDFVGFDCDCHLAPSAN